MIYFLNIIVFFTINNENSYPKGRALMKMYIVVPITKRGNCVETQNCNIHSNAINNTSNNKSNYKGLTSYHDSRYICVRRLGSRTLWWAEGTICWRGGKVDQCWCQWKYCARMLMSEPGRQSTDTHFLLTLFKSSQISLLTHSKLCYQL